jgi:hypothetical protein
MGEALTKKPEPDAGLESLITTGNLANLTPEQRSAYYLQMCESLQLNPAGLPFVFIMLNGKLVLYPKKECADQLRAVHGVSTTILSRAHNPELQVYEVVVRAVTRDGRSAENVGCVTIPTGATGDVVANARKKAVTQAERRVTFSLYGLSDYGDGPVQEERVPVQGLLQRSEEEAGYVESLPEIVEPEPEPVPAETQKAKDLTKRPAVMPDSMKQDANKGLAAFCKMREAYGLPADDVDLMKKHISVLFGTGDDYELSELVGSDWAVIVEPMKHFAESAKAKGYEDENGKVGHILRNHGKLLGLINRVAAPVVYEFIEDVPPVDWRKAADAMPKKLKKV